MSVKRAVVRADVDGQLSLFADDSINQSSRQPSSPGSRVFVEPDPERMQIGLKEHLQQCGAENVFIIDRLLKEQDWSVFESAYARTGRAPYAPRAMVALILFGVMQGKSSLRDLESLSRDSLSCLWLTGGIMPDHSIIGRFIHRHASVLCGEFFEGLTRSVLQHTHSDIENTAGDGTVIEAAASRYETIRREALEKRIEKEQQCLDDKDDPLNEEDKKRIEARLEKLIEAESRLSEREEKRKKKGKSPEGIQINPQDPDAVNQKLKRQGYGICFKPGVLVNPLRVIVGYGVHATSETEVAIESLAQAERIGTMQESSWDAGYSNYEMLLKQESYGIQMLIPEGQDGVSRKNRSKKYPKSEFIYDAELDTYRCPAGSILTNKSTYKVTATNQSYTLYGTRDCKHCKQRESCTTNKTGRRIERSIHEHLREQMRENMQSESTQERYRKRSGMVEPVFSSLQQQQGLTRFRRKGLAAVRLEFVLHVLAHNVSRAVAN